MGERALGFLNYDIIVFNLFIVFWFLAIKCYVIGLCRLLSFFFVLDFEAGSLKRGFGANGLHFRWKKNGSEKKSHEDIRGSPRKSHSARYLIYLVMVRWINFGICFFGN